MEATTQSGMGPVTVTIDEDGSFTARDAYNVVKLKKLKDGTYSGRTDFKYYHLDSNSLFIESGDGVDFYKKES